MVVYAPERAENLPGQLPRNEARLRRLTRIWRRIRETATADRSLDQMHAFIDEIQAELNVVHDRINGTWFSLDATTVSATESAAR